MKKEYVAYFPLDFYTAVVVYEIKHGIEDTVLVGWHDEEKTVEKKIEYNEDGRPYFTFHAETYFLDECMKTNK